MKHNFYRLPAFLIFTLIWVCCLYSQPHSNSFNQLSIEELHQAAEDVINFAEDSTYKLLVVAQERIQCLPEGSDKAHHQGENHLRWADYYWAGYIPQSKYHLQKAFEYYKKHPHNKKLAEAYYVKSVINLREGNREVQMAYLDTSITYALLSQNPQIISTIYVMQGFNLQTYNRWQESFEKARLAVEYARASGDSLPISASYFILAQIKQHFNQLEEAEKLFEKSIKYGKGHYDMAGVYRGYGAVLLQNQKIDEGLAAFRHSMALYLEDKKYPYVMLIRVRIGEALLSQGWIEQARDNFAEAKNLEAKLPSDIHIHYLHFAKMLAFLGQEKQAHHYIDRFMQHHQINQLKGEKVDLIRDLAEVYEVLGKKENAIKYYKTWGGLKDSLQSLTSQNQLTEMERLYISEKSKNEEITAKNEELIASKKTQVLLGGGGLIVLILAGCSVYFVHFRAQKEREALRLQIKGTQLKQMLTAQEDERKRLARELHDGIGQSLAALKMQLQMADDSHTSNRIIKRVNEICSEVRSLSHQMMPLILQENGLNEALEWLADQSLVKKSLKVDLVVQGRSDRLAPEIETHLYRVAQELLANIVKHAQAKTVGIQLLRPKGKVILIIEDNGIGFNPNKIYQGIGLANIHSRIEAINGEIEVQPNEGRGTYVRIVVPVNEIERLTA